MKKERKKGLIVPYELMQCGAFLYFRFSTLLLGLGKITLCIFHEGRKQFVKNSYCTYNEKYVTDLFNYMFVITKTDVITFMRNVDSGNG
jgi:hypothetical protein